MPYGSNTRKSRTNIVMMWLSFEYLAVAVPVLVMMAVHNFILRDFDVCNYVIDLLLLALSLVTNVVAETVRVKDNINQFVYWGVMIIDILIILFLMATYCSILPILMSLIIDSKLFIIHFCIWVIAVNLIVGIIFTFFEDV